MNVETAINLALEEAARENAASSQHCYRWLADQVRLRFAGRTLDTLTRFELQAWVQDQRQRLSAQSIRAQISFVNRLFRIAQVDNARQRYLTPEEEARLFEALGPWREYAEFSILTGMRWGNQMALEWGDILWDQGMALLKKTKSGKRQFVVLTARAIEILRRIKGKSVYCFPSAEGCQLHHSNFRRRHWLPALKKAEIKDFNWHDLRHTAASKLVRAGHSLHLVAAVLGHSDHRMTARYSHLATSDLREALEEAHKANSP